MSTKAGQCTPSEEDGSSRAGVVQDAIEANVFLDEVMVPKESDGMAKQSSSTRMSKEDEAKADIANNSELEPFLAQQVRQLEAESGKNRIESRPCTTKRFLGSEHFSQDSAGQPHEENVNTVTILSSVSPFRDDTETSEPIKHVEK